MIYDVVIIGAGAAGLFCGANYPKQVKGLILEAKSTPANKLLLSGLGQCNITNSGNIKDFVNHYGDNGKRIRSILYKFNNLALIDFFENNGLKTITRDDGKVFPLSFKSADIVHLLLEKTVQNGFHIECDSKVTSIDYIHSKNQNDKLFNIVTSKKTSYKARKLIITSGGCSYPQTGSDGSMFELLKNIGVEIIPTKPALVPIHVHQYPFESLSGISFPNARVSLINVEKAKGLDKRSQKTVISELEGDLLLTHRNFSGPSIINISRYANADQLLQISYYTSKDPKTILTGLKNRIPGNPQQVITFLYEYLSLPKRFLEIMCERAKVNPTEKISSLPDRQLKNIVTLITSDSYKISGLGGYNIAMATVGGVSLDEINPKTLESIKFPGLYFAGEILDVDGDTGGYNMQFAFSSGYVCANS
ncbi:MAG: NAD(P)/FAD-dependent oxidoreductase [Eubacteriales bacterium]